MIFSKILDIVGRIYW